MSARADEVLAYYYLGILREYLQSEDTLPLLAEIVEKREILDDLEEAVRNVGFFRTKSWNTVFELGLYRIVSYILVRLLKPGVFVETGVLHGITSHFILAAMKKNRHGCLVSIDLPSYFESGPANQDGYNDTLPPGMEPGWVIPERNRGHWKLLIGRSQEKLPGLLKQYPCIDIFLHDSEHIYNCMYEEYSLAWESLKKGGVLMSDNIDSTDAFPDFCRYVARKPLLLPEAIYPCTLDGKYRFGLILK